MTPETMIDWMQANVKPDVIPPLVFLVLTLFAIGFGYTYYVTDKIVRSILFVLYWPARLLAWPWRVWRNRRKRRGLWRTDSASTAFQIAQAIAAHGQGFTAIADGADVLIVRKPEHLAAIAQAHRDCPVEQKPGVRAWRSRVYNPPTLNSKYWLVANGRKYGLATFSHGDEWTDFGASKHHQELPPDFWEELTPTEAIALDAQRRGADSTPADPYEPVGTLPVVGDRVTITRLGNHTERYMPGRWWVGQELTVKRIEGSGDDRIVFFGDDYEPSLGICAFMRDDHNEGVYYAAGYFIRARILKRQKPALAYRLADDTATALRRDVKALQDGVADLNRRIDTTRKVVERTVIHLDEHTGVDWPD